MFFIMLLKLFFERGFPHINISILKIKVILYYILMPGSGEYGFSGEKGPHRKTSYESIAKTVGRKSLKRLKEKYGTDSLERLREKREKELRESQRYYNYLPREVPEQRVEGAKNVGVRAFTGSRKVFGIPPKISSPKDYGEDSLGGGRKRKTHKKRRLNKKKSHRRKRF